MGLNMGDDMYMGKGTRNMDYAMDNDPGENITLMRREQDVNDGDDELMM